MNMRLSCGSSYIGQTKRTIAERVKEHIAAVKNRQVNKSAIAEHLLESGPNHWIELHNPKILSRERHYYSRIVREAVEIRKYRNFNREDGFKLSPSWNPVISKCKPHLQSRSENSDIRENYQDAMDRRDIREESVKKPSLKTLITWNISKAIENNPQIDLREALYDIQQRLESYDAQALISSDVHNLSCAFLAWQRLGHHHADSLLSFVEQVLIDDIKNTENQYEGSDESIRSESETTPEIFQSIPSRKEPSIKSKCGWGSSNSFGAAPGVVVKLPVEPQIVMRLTGAIKVAKKPKQPCTQRHPPVRDTTRRIDSACCIEEGCISTLQSMEAETKALRERAVQVAKREAMRSELLDRAEMAWRDLDIAYQRRLQQAHEKETSIEKKIANLLDERNAYKAECLPMAEALQKKSEQAENERAALKQLDKIVAEKAFIRHDLQKTDLLTSTQLTEHQCKISQLDRDLALGEELEVRRQRMLTNALEAAQVILHETEHAQRTELQALSGQVKQVTQELLEEDSRNGLLKDRIAKYLEQKQEMIDDLEECQARCDKHMEEKMNSLKKLKEELSQSERKAKECVCKSPVDQAVEVKRTASLAALCKCSLSEQFQETCSCLSLASKLLSSLLMDLFGGLKSEMDNIGSQMPCHLLKCLEDNHKWDRSTDVKKHIRAYFSRLLLSELDITISTTIEKNRDQWLNPPTRGSAHSSTSSHRVKTQKRAGNHQQMFQEKGLQVKGLREKGLQAEGSGSYCDCCKDIVEPSCPQYSSAVYRCSVQPQAVRNLTTSKRVPSNATCRNWKNKTSSQYPRLENVKKDTKGTTMPLLRTLQPLDKIRKKIKDISYQSLPKNNKSAYTSTTLPRRNTTFKAKKPNKLVVNKKDEESPVKDPTLTNVSNEVLKVPQQFAVNLCLCDKNKNGIIDDANTDTNVIMKTSCNHIPQVSSMRKVNPVSSSYESHKLKESEATELDTCPTKGGCFHKLPSNTSVDKLIRLLTKWKDELTDLPEERIKTALEADSLFKITRTKKVDDLHQLYSQMDAKMSLDDSVNSTVHYNNIEILHDSRSVKIDDKGDKPNISDQITANESEYMTDINLERSKELLNVERTNIEDRRENTIPLQCINFEKRDAKGFVSTDSKLLDPCAEMDSQFARESEKSPMINMLNSSTTQRENYIQCLGVTLCNANDRSKRSLNKYSTSHNNENNTLHYQKRKINYNKSQYAINENNINEKFYEKLGDTNIQFLGVVLDNVKTNRMLKEHPYKQQEGADNYYQQATKHHNNKPDKQTNGGSCKTSYTVYQTETVKDFCPRPFSKNGNRLSSEACICCPTSDGDSTNDLEVNTFQLLSDHLKCKLEELKLSVCKSTCMQNADEKSIVNDILLKVKQIILDSASTVTSDYTGNKKFGGRSWNRAHCLLQEYLKTKIDRVRCQYNTSDDNPSKSMVPCVLSKISSLIDNDLQRLKDVCKCKNGTLSNKSIFKIHNTNSSIKPEKNHDNNFDSIDPKASIEPLKINESMIINDIKPYNKSVQALFQHPVENKSCEAIKTFSQISEVQTDLETDTDNRFASKDKIESKIEKDGHTNNRPDEYSDKTDETVTMLDFPYIGYTMNCNCNRNIGCVCTKSSILKNTECLKKSGVWDVFTQKQRTNKEISYLLKNLLNSPKSEDITVELDKKENIDTNKDDTCDSGVSANEEVNVTLKISNPKLDRIFVHDASNDNLFRAKMTSDYSQMSDISCDCNCSMVPVCHVKMLVDSIATKLDKAECTCDSLKAVCPVHS